MHYFSEFWQASASLVAPIGSDSMRTWNWWAADRFIWCFLSRVRCMLFWELEAAESRWRVLGMTKASVTTSGEREEEVPAIRFLSSLALRPHHGKTATRQLLLPGAQRPLIGSAWRNTFRSPLQASPHQQINLCTYIHFDRPSVKAENAWCYLHQWW